MRRKTTKKRRLAVAAIFALTVAVTAPFLAPGAGALVANPGVLDVAMNLTVSTPNFTVAGMRTTGLGAATMGKNGIIKIPKSSLSFDPVVVKVDLPQPITDPSTTTVPGPTTATVQAVAMSDFSGGLDPGNGAAFIVGDLEEIWTQAGTMTNCIVGPFHVAARTNAQGAVAYSAKTGSVSMVDPGFTVDAVPVSAPGCGGLEGAVNTALALPVTTTTTTTNPSVSTTTTTIPINAEPPVPSVVVGLTFMPAPQAAAPVPVKRPHEPQNQPTTPATQPQATLYIPVPGANSPPAKQPGRSVGRHPTRRGNGSRRSVSDSTGSSASAQIKRGLAQGWSAGLVPKRTVHVKHPTRAHKPAPKKRAAQAAASQNLTYTNAAFIKPPRSALATGLDLIGLLGLLGFSSLALWLVTTELSEFSAVSRRLRTHRIAGITK
jgi:hypothetical protein